MKSALPRLFCKTLMVTLLAFSVLSYAPTASAQQSMLLVPKGSDPILSVDSQERFEAQVATAIRTQAAQVSTIFQLGVGNAAGSITLISPGSSILQSQIGINNTSRAAIAGGAANSIAVDQVGANLDSSVNLLNSRGTQVLHRQRGVGATGGVTIINGYPGLRVTLN